MGTKQLEQFTLKGGACDGQVVFLQCSYNEHGWCPPPHCEAMEQKPLKFLSVSDAPPMTETVARHVYNRIIFSDGNRTWYEFHSHSTPPEPSPLPTPKA